jgi:hypothetical protein
MSGQPPVRDQINDRPLHPAEPLQSRPDLGHEGRQVRSEVAAHISLEGVPLAFFRVEFRAVACQPDHLQPVGPCGQRRLTLLAGMGRPIVEHQDHVPSAHVVPLLQRRQIRFEPNRVLACLQHFDPSPAIGRDTAEHRQTPVRSGGRDGRLHAASMP